MKNHIPDKGRVDTLSFRHNQTMRIQAFASVWTKYCQRWQVTCYKVRHFLHNHRTAVTGHRCCNLSGRNPCLSYQTLPLQIIWKRRKMARSVYTQGPAEFVSIWSKKPQEAVNYFFWNWGNVIWRIGPGGSCTENVWSLKAGMTPPLYGADMPGLG